ncbi:unnamed protein product, partial [Schistosoma mattheei]
NNNNNNTEERIIEQTLLKLEPHISELVGQSLRTSIETIKNEMLSNFKRINNHSSMNLLHNQSEINENNKTLEIRNQEIFPETFQHFNDPHKDDTNSNEEMKPNDSIEMVPMEKMDHLTNNLKQHLHNTTINTNKQMNNNNNNKILPSNNLMDQSIENDQISIINNHLSNIVTHSNDPIQSAYKTLLTNNTLKLPINNLTFNSMNHMNPAYSTCNIDHNDSINNCIDTIDFNKQIIHSIHEEKEKSLQFPSFFTNLNENNNQIYSRISSNDLSMINTNSPPSSSQPVDYINSNQSVDINSSENVTSSMLTNTTTSTSSSCDPVTAAAAAAALANVLGFPIPYSWSPKTLTDMQDAYGLLSNPYYHWPWKLLNSSYASKYSDQNTLLQSSSLVNNTMNIIKQLNKSLLQSTSDIIDLGQALNLVTSTSTSFGLSVNQMQTDDKESLLISQNLLPGINQAKYRNTVISTGTSTCSIINNTSNLKLDDFYSAKYRSENQIHSGGSNNSSPSPISLRLSGYSKEMTDNTSENPKGHCHENVDISESDKNIDYQFNGVDEKLHCLNTLQEYKSFEKIFSKTLKSYPLSLKSNLLNNIGTLPAAMNTVSSSTPSTYSPSVFKDINTSLVVTSSTSLSISSTFPTTSTASVPVTSPCASVCSDINQRKFLSRFNQICLLNSRLPNSLPPIPPIFFNPTDDTINNNFNHISNNNTNNTNKFSTSNFYDYTSIQNDGQERQQQSLSHSFGAKTNINYSQPHNISLSSSLPCKSPSPYSLSSKSSIFSPSQSFTSVIGSIDYNNVITTAANNSIDHNNTNMTTVCSSQNKHHRPQQNLPNLNSKQHHNHISYINKLYDKLNASENLLNIKLDKSLLLNDNFSSESTSGITLSESYQNQLINYSHELRMTTTLTPVHLRKAKLMFFYTRYPNSTLIKMYFPDVKFYKNNTAQLVKWFSNFR